jgi:ribonucleotide monophosphatase NagD (HAD superfamily)
MAAILLDVDGVLHVSGEPIPGAVEAVTRLRADGHRLRFVTNNSTRARAELATELRELGFELEDDELQTTPIAAAEQLGGRRVYGLMMSAILPDLAASSSSARARTPCSSAAATRRRSRTRSSAT